MSDDDNLIDLADYRPQNPELVPVEDFGVIAHKAAEAHLNECMAALDAEEEGDDSQWPEDMAGPFCGCQTCIIRETLHAAFPIIVEALGGEQ